MLIRRLLTYSILSLVALGGFFGSVHIETESRSHSIVSMSYEGNGVYACSSAERDGQGCPSEGINGMDLSSGNNTTPANAVVPTDPVKAGPIDMTKGANVMIDSLNIILGFVTLVISPAILFAGWLMSPDWTSGDLFGLRTPMYALWVTVSNIVYFVYAILLILIALGTMFGKESFSYKVMLPKLALGILMVPFTWWFVQWTISLSAVVTASVITIPMETISTKADGWIGKPTVPRKITINESGSEKINIAKCPDECVSPIDFLRKQSGMYGYMMVYAYSIFKFDQVKELSLKLDSIKTLTGIIHQGLVGVLMFLVFGLLTLALVAMLLVRAIKLWVYAIFSPLFTFQFVAGGAMKGVDKSETFTIKEFVGLCFVPAIVGLTLSFGLILINAISNGTVGNGTTCNSATIINPGCTMARLMGSDDNKITRKIEVVGTGSTTTNTIIWGDMTIDFVGKAGASKDAATEATNVTQATGVLDSAGGIFGTLIIDIIALVFIWMAFMAAKNVSKAVSMAVEPFENIGKQVGSLAKSIPKYTPIPGLGMSANSMGKVVTNAENAMIGASDKKFKKSAAGKLFGGERVVATVDEKKLADAMNAVGSRYDDKANLKIMGDQIEKQTNRDIEYSSMFKNVAELVKKIDSPVHKEELLKNMGYSPDNAKKIVEQLAKKGGELDKNDTTLMSALKSRVGAPAGGAQNGTSGFTQTSTKNAAGVDEVRISLGNITNLSVDKGGTLTQASIDELLKDGKNQWTKEEFEKNIKSFTSDVQAGIKKAINNPSDFYKPKP